MKSIRLFMATCGHESGKGTIALENLNADGTTTGDYKPNERGAGYIQITWAETHKKFLETIPGALPVPTSYNGNTAKYISEKYPWEAAMWFWSSKDAHTTSAGSINNYAVKYGDSLNVFLVTQLFVNGWPRYADNRKDENGKYKRMPNSYAVDIRDGRVNWSISNGILRVYNEEFVAPNGWATAQTGRLDCYNLAMKTFK